jgi:hypothetical protein
MARIVNAASRPAWRIPQRVLQQVTESLLLIAVSFNPLLCQAYRDYCEASSGYPDPVPLSPAAADERCLSPAERRDWESLALRLR